MAGDVGNQSSEKFLAQSTKSQSSSKFQYPNITNLVRANFGIWNLVLLWRLGFGDWCFSLSTRSPIQSHDLINRASGKCFICAIRPVPFNRIHARGCAQAEMSARVIATQITRSRMYPARPASFPDAHGDARAIRVPFQRRVNGTKQQT